MASNRILRAVVNRTKCDIDIGACLTLTPCWRVCAQDGGPVARGGTGDPTGGGGAHGGRASSQAGVCSDWLRRARWTVLISISVNGNQSTHMSVIIFTALVLWRWFWSLPITTQASIGVGRFIVYHQHNTSLLLLCVMEWQLSCSTAPARPSPRPSAKA